jgi:hypothetical protein
MQSAVKSACSIHRFFVYAFFPSQVPVWVLSHGCYDKVDATVLAPSFERENENPWEEIVFYLKRFPRYRNYLALSYNFDFFTFVLFDFYIF